MNLLAFHSESFQGGHGTQALLNLGEVHRWPQNPLTKKTRTHACCGFIESAKQGRGNVFAGQRFDEFKVANGDAIEDQRIVLLVKADVIEMLQPRAGWPKSGNLCCSRRLGRAVALYQMSVLAEVVDNRAGGGNGLWMVFQSKAREVDHPKLLAQHSRRVVMVEDPFVEQGSRGGNAIKGGGRAGSRQCTGAAGPSRAGSGAGRGREQAGC